MMENKGLVFWIRTVVLMKSSKSYWINIPAEYAEKMNIQKGQKMELQVDKHGNLVILKKRQ